MAVSLKCAACGAEVEFDEFSPRAEETCPGCEVRVRQRPGDEHMAIPISMNLPEEFQQVDLEAVSHKSDTLVERYRKPEIPAAQGLTSEFVLAKALETLATSIQHLEERMDCGERPQKDAESGTNGYRPEAPARSPRGNGGSSAPPQTDHGVVQLQPESAAVKARPVGARVLVRREAARAAHAFRREKHTQKDWDDRPDHPPGPTGFRWMMEYYPKTTFIVTFLGVLAIAVLIFMSMAGAFSQEEEVGEALRPLETTALSDLWADDPEAAQAEAMARGFLNATSARTAAPFIFESGRIQNKLDLYYRPISSPEDYRLTLKSRAVAPDGQSIFAYQVWVGNEVPRMLVVLPEGKMPKVFWEFFAEIGDLSWEAFLKERPSEPTLLRVWASQGESFYESYDAEDWQCYILHDLAQKQKIFAYVERGTGADWRLANALETKPVKFQRHSAIMAQVKLSFMAEIEDPGAQRVYVAEIKEVPATSWLPKRYLHPEEEK